MKKTFIILVLILACVGMTHAAAQRSISTNAVKIGWYFHGHVGASSNPGAGYFTVEDPNEANDYLTIEQAPTANWNEGLFARSNAPTKVINESGNTGSAFMIHNNDSMWHTSWYLNVTKLFEGSLLEHWGTAEELEDGKNLARLTEGYWSINGGKPLVPITSVKKVPYGDYMVVAYVNPNRTGDQQQVAVEDQSFYSLNEHGQLFKGHAWEADDVWQWTRGRVQDPNTYNWKIATDTTGPSNKTANIFIFRHLSAPDMDLMYDCTANSGVNAYQIISEVNADDIVTQVLPGNSDKDFGDTPASVTTMLEWAAPVNGADSYQVYLGMYGHPTDPNLYAIASTGTTASPTLAYNTSYVWRVDTVKGDETIAGDYMYFDTEGDPILQVQPNSVSVKAGSDTFFTVGALLTDTYTWYYSADDAVDTPGDDVLLQSGPDATLPIEGAQEGVDTGYYFCILTNDIPDTVAVTSATASLEIGKLEVYLPFDGDPNDASLEGGDSNGFDAVPSVTDPANHVANTYDVGYDGSADGAIRFVRSSQDTLKIDGSEDHFNFYPKGFTVRFWVKPTDYGEVNGFMTYIAKGDSGWRMQDTAFYYGVGLEAKMYPLGAGTDVGRLDDGDWHMIACTYDAATQEMKVYQEGFLMATRTGALNDVSGNTKPVTIGSHWLNGTGGDGWCYDGLIDEVEIFSYAISEYDILDDYAAKTGLEYCFKEVPGDLDGDCQVGMSDLAIVTEEWLDSTDPETATLAELDSRVVSWQFDETSGMVAADSSGNGIDGTLGAGFTTGQWIVDGGRTGETGDNALYMDGSADTSVIATVADPNAVPAGNIFKGTAEWTMNIWVKLFTAEMNNIGGFGQNAWLDPSVDSDRYFASWDGGLEFELGQTGLFPGTSMGAEWSMLTATYDGTTCTVYANGAQVSQMDVALVDTVVNEINLNTARRVLWSGVDATVPMNAHVDDFSIWGEAFNAAHVAGMYTNSFVSCDGAIDSDLNGDCEVDLYDFAIMAADWLECNLVPSSLCD